MQNARTHFEEIPLDAMLKNIEKHLQQPKATGIVAADKRKSKIRISGSDVVDIAGAPRGPNAPGGRS